MAISKTDITIAKNSLAQAHEHFKPGDTYFYDQLFTYAPNLKTMFRDDLAGQGMKFMSTLATIIEAFEHSAQDNTELAELAKGHAAMGIEARHFAPMLDALIDTLKRTLGPEFSPQIETAWRNAFSEISDQMIRAGSIAS